MKSNVICTNFCDTRMYVLKNDFLKVEVLEHGGIIRSIITKDKMGNDIDVVLGYDTLSEYYDNDGYFGAIIGRVCNRISNGKFIFDGKEYTLHKNDGQNTLHGGRSGFDKKCFNSKVEDDKLILSYYSKNLEENFPGDLNLEVIYQLVDNSLVLKYNATTSSKTICNLTNHTYFNLDGSSDVLDTKVMINADYITDVNEFLIPNGKLVNICNTPLDFKSYKSIGEDIRKNDNLLIIGKGYDFNYCLLNSNSISARAYSLKSGIELTVKTNQLGLQFYSGNFISDRIGKNNSIYHKRSGFCFEPQNYPDSINNKSFPSIVIDCDHPYYQETIYTFNIVGENND